MKKINFRSIENISVTDELQEKLMSIPQTVEKANRVRRLRYAAAAACLVLVTVIGVILVPKSVDTLPIERVPAPAPRPTESVAVAQLETEPETSAAPVTESSENPTEFALYQHQAEATEAALYNIGRRNTVSVTEPSEASRPTEASTERATEPEAATSAEPETVTPTEAPTGKPGGNVDFAPTAKWINYLSAQSLSGIIQESMLTGSGKVYFRIYAFDGSPLGAEDLFSTSNQATITQNKYHTVTASYYLGTLADDLAKIQKGDCLTYCFFNEDGESVYTDIKIF